jgi:hypothetical protein
MDVFWIVAPFSLEDVYRSSRGACRLHCQGDEAASTYEMSVKFYQTTRHNKAEESHFHTRRPINLKSHKIRKIYSFDYIKIPKAFFSRHHGR